MNKKTENILAFVSLGVVPFVVALVQFFRKGSDDLVTRKDLLVLFGIQLALIAALAVKVFYFTYAKAVLF